MRVWVTAGQTKFNLEEVQRSRKKGDSSLAGLGAGADIRQQKSVAVYSVCSAWNRAELRRVAGRGSSSEGKGAMDARSYGDRDATAPGNGWF